MYVHEHGTFFVFLKNHKIFFRQFAVDMVTLTCPLSHKCVTAVDAVISNVSIFAEKCYFFIHYLFVVGAVHLIMNQCPPFLPTK